MALVLIIASSLLYFDPNQIISFHIKSSQNDSYC